MEARTDCPICQCSTAHVNNHVRMSNGDGHGPTQTYPDGWDRDAEQFTNQGADQGAVDVAIDDDEPDEPDAVALTIDDRPSDQREYECPECETPVEYLDEECSNEHEQQWYA